MHDQQNAFSGARRHDIIDMIRKCRNDRIKDFLDERNLVVYLSAQFRIIELSASKAEMIKNALSDLLIAPVNTGLYRPIIEAYKTPERVPPAEEADKLFDSEIKEVLKKYLYQT